MHATPLTEALPEAADLRKRFRFLGEHGVFYLLYVVGEQVPPYDEWARSRGVEMR